jgi:hypothetical protein
MNVIGVPMVTLCAVHLSDNGWNFVRLLLAVE